MLESMLTVACEQYVIDDDINTVIGIDIDYETVGERGGMLMVSVSGTAVTVR